MNIRHNTVRKGRGNAKDKGQDSQNGTPHGTLAVVLIRDIAYINFQHNDRGSDRRKEEEQEEEDVENGSKRHLVKELRQDDKEQARSPFRLDIEG